MTANRPQVPIPRPTVSDEGQAIVVDGAGRYALSLIEGGGGIDSGTAFPVTPTEGMMFYRTDLKGEFAYFDSLWVCLVAMDLGIHVGDDSATGNGLSSNDPCSPSNLRRVQGAAVNLTYYFDGARATVYAFPSYHNRGSTPASIQMVVEGSTNIVITGWFFCSGRFYIQGRNLIQLNGIVTAGIIDLYQLTGTGNLTLKDANILWIESCTFYMLNVVNCGIDWWVDVSANGGLATRPSMTIEKCWQVYPGTDWSSNPAGVISNPNGVGLSVKYTDLTIGDAGTQVFEFDDCELGLEVVFAQVQGASFCTFTDCTVDYNALSGVTDNGVIT